MRSKQKQNSKGLKLLNDFSRMEQAEHCSFKLKKNQRYAEGERGAKISPLGIPSSSRSSLAQTNKLVSVKQLERRHLKRKKGQRCVNVSNKQQFFCLSVNKLGKFFLVENGFPMGGSLSKIEVQNLYTQDLQIWQGFARARDSFESKSGKKHADELQIPVKYSTLCGIIHPNIIIQKMETVNIDANVFPWHQTHHEQYRDFLFIDSVVSLPIVTDSTLIKMLPKIPKGNGNPLPSYTLELRHNFIALYNATASRHVAYFPCSTEINYKILSKTPLTAPGYFQLTLSHKEFTEQPRVFRILLECKHLLDTFETFLGRNKILRLNFHDEFKPLRRIGSGGCGAVYSAVPVNATGKRYAVKALSKSTLHSMKGNGWKAFEKELETMCEVSNDGLISIHRTYQSANTIYIVMEELDYSFTKYLERNYPLANGEVLRITKDLLKSLEYLHSIGIMHRDIKLDNIVFRVAEGAKPKPVIIDFGLAQHVNQPDYLFKRCGTPGYAAPEILKSQVRAQFPQRCDIFSLGVILHYLLFGKPAFKGSNCKEILENTLRGVRTLDDQEMSSVEPELRDLLNKMLIIDNSTRISAREALMHAVFKQCEADLPAEKGDTAMTDSR